MAEELALEEMLGERRAGDRDEGAPLPRTPPVDGGREHILPGAALACQQHGNVGACRLASRVERAEHQRARRLEQHGLVDGAPEPAVLPLERLHLEHAREEKPGMVQRERLHEVVVRAGAHRLDRLRDGGVRRHQHDDRVGPLAADLAQQREAVHAGHADVREDHVELGPPERRERRGSIRDRFHRVAEAADVRREMRADVLLVVDDEDGCHVSRAAARA